MVVARYLGVLTGPPVPGMPRFHKLARPGQRGTNPVGVKGHMGPLAKTDHDGVGTDLVQKGAENDRFITRLEHVATVGSQSLGKAPFVADREEGPDGINLPIDVTTGHASPYIYDFDGDGNRDRKPC